MASDAAGQTFGGKEPNPPSWDGSDPGVELANYEKNVKLWLFESELEKKKQGVRLLRNLTGVARQVADTMEFDEVATEQGVDNLLKALKKHCQPHLEVSLPRAFERAVYGAPRGHRESMHEYIIRMGKNFHLLEKEGLKLPDVATGYVTYRQASLTEGQELKFSTWSQGAYDLPTVVASLRKLEKVVPEHKSKTTTAFMQDDAEIPNERAEDEDIPEPYVLDDDDQHIYLEVEDDEKVLEENEVQVALATYQEVRKAINQHQKGRQFYGKGKGDGKRGSGARDFGHEFMKNKRRISIEQLKLRTRCGRCGLVGHWAKECKNAPDKRGQQQQQASFASGASVASNTSKPSSTSAASTGQQSWYVSAGNSNCASDGLVTFCGFECGGQHTKSNDECKSTELNSSHGNTRRQEDGASSELCLGCSAHVASVFDFGQPEHFAVALFVGLSTSPELAVVDTAAQDGLIGAQALSRLKERLGDHGLKVKWTTKQARAHGVGGQARVLGIIAIPLGIAGTTGILEATVIWNSFAFGSLC